MIASTGILVLATPWWPAAGELADVQDGLAGDPAVAEQADRLAAHVLQRPATGVQTAETSTRTLSALRVSIAR